MADSIFEFERHLKGQGLCLTYLTPPDRIQLLADLLKLVTADKLDITFPLQFLTYMKKETEFGPWKLATEHWHELMNKMSPAEKFAAKVKV